MASIQIDPKTLSNEFSIEYTVDAFTYSVGFTTVNYGDTQGSSPQMRVFLLNGDVLVKQNSFDTFADILGLYMASFTRDGLPLPTEEFVISVIQEAFRAAALADYASLAQVIAKIYGFTIVVTAP